MWQKLAALVVAMALPGALLGFFYLQQANTVVHQAREEIEGARFAEALGAVHAEMMNHRAVAYGFLNSNGDENKRNAVSSKLADNVQVLIRRVSIESGMTRDPDRTTALLVDAATAHITDAMVAYSNVRWNAAKVAIQGNITGDTRMALKMYRDDAL